LSQLQYSPIVETQSCSATNPNGFKRDLPKVKRESYDAVPVRIEPDENNLAYSITKTPEKPAKNGKKIGFPAITPTFLSCACCKNQKVPAKAEDGFYLRGVVC